VQPEGWTPNLPTDEFAGACFLIPALPLYENFPFAIRRAAPQLGRSHKARPYNWARAHKATFVHGGEPQGHETLWLRIGFEQYRTLFCNCNLPRAYFKVKTRQIEWA